MATLKEAFKALALKLQEQATSELSHNDLCKWLNDACNGAGCWLMDVFGDGESGDAIVCMNGDMKRIQYEVRQVNGKSTVTLDMDNAVDVLPRTTYEEEADDADHYAAMEGKRTDGQQLYTETPVYERSIPKSERDNAPEGSFAGKGKSYPILKPQDVMAAVHSIGRAGSGNYDAGTLKRNISRIAKAKGFGKYLPQAWQGGEEPKEAADLEIVGDFVALKEGAVGQDGTAYLKLIAPGRGSSGYYPAEVLERDGPKVFKAGTKNFWNHQTDAEEAARPEGDLRDLASVLTEDAHYERSGPAGPGLYARAKVFDAFRQPVDDLAKHIGMSIRASGKAKEGKAPDGKPGPIIEQLTRGISVDYVTTPGAGGQILQLFEAARQPQSNHQEGADEMDAAELKKLQESARKNAAKLARFEARETVGRKLAGIRLSEDAKRLITERACINPPLTSDGDLDNAALETLVEGEIRYVAGLMGHEPAVIGMGTADTQPTPEQITAREAAAEAERKELAVVLGFGGKEHKQGRKILMEGRSAFDPNYVPQGEVA